MLFITEVLEVQFKVGNIEYMQPKPWRAGVNVGFWDDCLNNNYKRFLPQLLTDLLLVDWEVTRKACTHTYTSWFGLYVVYITGLKLYL